MRQPTDPLPSTKEATEETEKRLALIKKITPELKTFCDAMIVAGSVAMGKDYSVRKSSDIDIILLLQRKNIDHFNNYPFLTLTEQHKEGMSYFKKGDINHFSIVSKELEGIEIGLHIWDTETHLQVSNEDFKATSYNVWRKKEDFDRPYQGMVVGFQNDIKTITIPITKKCRYGVIHDYPSFLIIKKKFYMRQPIVNLTQGIDIIFCHDKGLYKAIKTTWDLIARHFINEGHTFTEKHAIDFMPAHWSFNKEKRRRTTETFKQALKRQGYQGIL